MQSGVLACTPEVPARREFERYAEESFWPAPTPGRRQDSVVPMLFNFLVDNRLLRAYSAPVVLGTTMEQHRDQDMHERIHKATLSQSQGREGWSVIFRHPVLPDRTTGKPGRRVRRGLGTKEKKAAERLVKHLNEMLADRVYWEPSSRPRALARFHPLVVDIFYHDMVPEPVDASTIREVAIPLPRSADSDYRWFYCWAQRVAARQRWCGNCWAPILPASGFHRPRRHERRSPIWRFFSLRDPSGPLLRFFRVRRCSTIWKNRCRRRLWRLIRAIPKPRFSGGC